MLISRNFCVRVASTRIKTNKTQIFFHFKTLNLTNASTTTFDGKSCRILSSQQRTLLSEYGQRRLALPGMACGRKP